MKQGKLIIIIGIVLFVLAFPLALLIGGFATDDPNGPWWAFFYGFFFIEAIPTLFILMGIIQMIMIKKKIQPGKLITIIGIALFVLLFPLAYLTGENGTTEVKSPWYAFLSGFFYIETIPVLLTFAGIFQMITDKKQNKLKDT